MSYATRSHLATPRTVERLVDEAVDAVAASLGFRPEVHLDWPDSSRVRRAVLDAVRDALDLSLSRVAHHRGATSAFVSVAWRVDTVEVCVVDDGSAGWPAGAAESSGVGFVDRGLVAASGVEHDVDEFGAAGFCQWWSIPVDLC